MMIALHKNARTTPAIRAEIAASGDSAAALAQRFGITEATVYKWKKRTSVHDASHTPHRLQTTLTPAQERVVVELRRTLLLPLDDLLAVTREFHPGRLHRPQEISVVGCTKGDEPVGGRSAESFNPCPVSPLMVIARHKNARVRHQPLQAVDLLEVATLNCHYSSVI